MEKKGSYKMAKRWGFLREPPATYDEWRYFITETLPQFDWGRSKEEEVVLNIGCGTGEVTFLLSQSVFRRRAVIFAIDFRANAVEYANQKNYNPFIHFKVANIEDWSAVKEWEGQISKIISLNYMQWIKDARQGFQHMFQLLNDEGEMAVRFTVSSPKYETVWNLAKHPKWSQFFKCPDNLIMADYHNDNVSDHYRIMLEAIGFTIRYFKEEELCQAFDSDALYREFIAKKLSFVHYVPIHDRAELVDYLFQGVLSMNDRDRFDRRVHRGSVIEVFAQKSMPEE